jgi:hypothetical protein
MLRAAVSFPTRRGSDANLGAHVDPLSYQFLRMLISDCDPWFVTRFLRWGLLHYRVKILIGDSPALSTRGFGAPLVEPIATSFTG